MRIFWKIIFTLLLNVTLCVSCKKTVPLRTGLALGTVCSVNAYEGGSDALYDALFERLNEIERIFSTRISTSDVCRINAAAGESAVIVSEECRYVLERALYVASITDGAFDPTVGPLVNLWGIGTEHEKVPSSLEIEAQRKLVDFRLVTLEGSSVFLQKKGMALDLGGIAKGYAADELTKILSEWKIKRALINLGGNVYAYGTKADGSSWEIGIRNPLTMGEGSVAVVSLLGSGSVVTSGAYERFFEQDGVRYHHIINPFTGRPSESNILSATILCKSSLFADALSTASFIMGSERFIALCLENNFLCGDSVRTDAILLCNDGKAYVSSGATENVRLYSAFTAVPF